MEEQIFNNERFGSIRVAGTSEEPLFCLVDVARCLGYSNPSKAVIDHCKGVTILETPTNGGVQAIKFGKEGDLYRLVMKSKADNAIEFQDWVCDEVLPSVRKTGGFVSDTNKFVDSYFGNLDEAARTFLAQSLENNKRLLDENKKQKQLIEQQAPKVEFFNAVADSKTAVPMNDVAKVLSIKGYGRNNLFDFLRNEKILMQDNRPYQTFIDRGYFRVIEQHYQVNGESHISFKTLVYQKGVDYIRKAIDNHLKQQ